MVGNSNNETNSLCKLLPPNTQVPRLHKASANSTSANLKFSKTQLSKMIQSGGFIELMDEVCTSNESYIRSSRYYKWHLKK